MNKSKFPLMHNMGIVVEDLDAAIRFFVELGLELEGRWRVIGRVE